MQASKADDDQPRVGSVLGRFDAQRGAADAAVVGCGPAGLALAAELASRGVQVALIGACCVRCQQCVTKGCLNLNFASMYACIAGQVHHSYFASRLDQGSHVMPCVNCMAQTIHTVNVVDLPGRDAPFVNNYGVWEDEFTELGLAHTLEHTWPDAVCYFGEGSEVSCAASAIGLPSALTTPLTRAAIKFSICHIMKMHGKAALDTELTCKASRGTLTAVS